MQFFKTEHFEFKHFHKFCENLLSELGRFEDDHKPSYQFFRVEKDSYCKNLKIDVPKVLDL